MEPNVSSPECQIHCLDRIPEPLGRMEVAWQLRFKLKRVLKRRLRYLRNQLPGSGGVAYASPATGGTAADQGLVAGQSVRVRSKEEIQATLDNWNYLRGCGFMEEMWPYCGTNQRVLKPVKWFLDERDYRFKKTRGIVFLEGLTCQGTIDYGRCDRSCYYFWREEWLEAVE
ncbi:MAG: hypothetical protein PVI80_07360 [Anaerolineae bacterium]